MSDQEYIYNHEDIVLQCTKEAVQQKKNQDVKGQMIKALEKITPFKEQLKKEKTKNAKLLETTETIKKLLSYGFKYEKEVFQLEGSAHALINLLENKYRRATEKILERETKVNSPTLNYFRYFNATYLLMDFFFNEAKEERHHIDKIHFYAFDNDPKEEIYKSFLTFLSSYFFTKTIGMVERDYFSQFGIIKTNSQIEEDLDNNLNLQRHSLLTVPYFKKSFSKELEHKDLIDSYTKEWVLINLFKSFSAYRQKIREKVPRIHQFVIEKNDFLKLPEIRKDLFHKNIYLRSDYSEYLKGATTKQDNSAYYEALDKVDSALRTIYSYSSDLYSKKLKFVTTLDFTNSYYEPPRNTLEYSLNTLKCELFLSKASHYFTNFLSRDIYVNLEKF